MHYDALLFDSLALSFGSNGNLVAHFFRLRISYAHESRCVLFFFFLLQVIPPRMTFAYHGVTWLA